MIIDEVGNIKIEKDNTEIYILKHKTNLVLYDSGIDGVFYDYETARKAQLICKKDKPTWDFIIECYNVITNIYEKKSF